VFRSGKFLFGKLTIRLKDKTDCLYPVLFGFLKRASLRVCAWKFFDITDVAILGFSEYAVSDLSICITSKRTP